MHVIARVDGSFLDLFILGFSTLIFKQIRVGQGFWLYGIQGLFKSVYGILQLK